MDQTLTDLLSLLGLEKIEHNIYRGESHDIGTPQVFGGQVLGQALSAASKTVTERIVHSLHAYFLRRGDINAPIIYQVDHARDGRSFSNRRIVAIQHGRQIFNMTASFQIPEDGLEHQSAMPEVPGPDGLMDIVDLRPAELEKWPERLRRFLETPRPFHMRPVRGDDAGSGSLEPVQYVWMKAIDSLPDEPDLHQVMLAYISDLQLLGTATLPHGDRNFMRENLQMASLDHAMWFHKPSRVDEWLLFAYDSPRAAGARGLARGLIFDQSGVLVASTAQEGLIRLR
ncbi:MAG: acyl-CoA thioesterase II [Gammaproteobacteria bacterium]|jgi:acyl-CoA thioesterase-2|nr:acyl-CoA thioesterase II [Chromatiales bacterium]MDP6675183.1 acyl-CoA thioesterase II [Gammaproteobacteria bacterium]